MCSAMYTERNPLTGSYKGLYIFFHIRDNKYPGTHYSTLVYHRGGKHDRDEIFCFHCLAKESNLSAFQKYSEVAKSYTWENLPLLSNVLRCAMDYLFKWLLSHTSATKSFTKHRGGNSE